MKKSTEKTLTYVGIGVVGLYVLSKYNLAGALGGGLGEVLGDAVSGLGSALGGAVEGLGEGIGKGAGGLIEGTGWGVAGVGTGILSPFVDLFAGAGTGAEYAATGKQVIKDEGLGVIFWSKDRIRQYVQPGAEKILPESGYKTPSGYTYIDASQQSRAATISRLLSTTANPAEAAYLLAVQEGKDVTTWNTAPFTPAFKKELGIT